MSSCWITYNTSAYGGYGPAGICLGSIKLWILVSLDTLGHPIVNFDL